MIVLEKRINYKYGDTIQIRPIFDIHFGNKLCDIDKFKKDINNGDEYIIGGGDWLDSVIIQDKRYKKSIDSSESDDIIDEQVDGLYDIVKDKKDRIIGLMTGNHENVVSSKYGTHPVRRICKRLEIPFLGYSCYVKLVLSEDKARTRTVLLKMHHGYGGGRTLGADLTRYINDMNFFEGDVFCFGHTHQKHWSTIERIGLSGNKIIHKPKHLLVCGTYLRTLTDNSDSTYSEEKGFRPVSLGGLVINLRPTYKWVDIWVDR